MKTVRNYPLHQREEFFANKIYLVKEVSENSKGNLENDSPRRKEISF